MHQRAHIHALGAERPCVNFVVAREYRGLWVARDTRRLIEGVFISLEAALRFARAEGGSTGTVTILAGSETRQERPRAA